MFQTKYLSVALFCCVLQSALAVEEIAQREAIRVGGNVQESKLIRRVEPIYPEAAKAARISGGVILQVTINESGEVADVRTLRGHPLMNQAAIDAVTQWRYQPTYLNGEAVPVIATVTVVFNPGSSYGLRVSMDESGSLRDLASGLQGEALMKKIRETDGTILVQPNPRIPFRDLEETLRSLEKEGAKNLQTQGSYLFRNSRLFYWLSGTSGQDGLRMQLLVRGTDAVPLVPPQLALDGDRLASLAMASGQVENIPQAGDGRRVLIYRLFVSEVGEILAVESMRGPAIPDLESELARTRVLTPGLLGADPVPTAVAVEVQVR